MEKKYKVFHTELVSEGSINYEGKPLSDHRTAADFGQPFFHRADREKAYVCCLDAKNAPIAMELISVGGRTEAPMDIPCVFRGAILSCASSIIIFHNHLSRDATPSQADYDITERICMSGHIVNITLLDHIIIARDGSYFSMAEHGVLDSFLCERRTVK